MKIPRLATLSLSIGLLAALAGCSRPPASNFQGYLEGDFVYIASPLAGRLDTLAVTKGSRIEAATRLFTLEHAAEAAAAQQAAAHLAAAQARLADARKGSRPTELDTLAARLAQARATAELSRLDSDRQAALFKNQVIAASDYDRPRLTHERDLRSLDDLTAQLATARLGARPDAISAAEEEVAAAAAALAQAEWGVAQKTRAAPGPALVYDTLYRVGEFVPAGQPVVSLLPPETIKVRFFVPEPALAALRPGQHVRVQLDGRPPLDATISFVSPQAEYTPPVLYNRDNRAKLVFLVEAVFRPEDARDLHPGQPVDVTPLTANQP
jgi:HlyD family secretion protein